MKKLRLTKAKSRFKSNEKIFTKFKIATDEETIQMCNQKSICRYGDGEFGFLFGKGIGFQEYNSKLAQRLYQILTEPNTNPNILVAIPKIFKRDFGNYNSMAYNFWERYYRKNIIKISKIINEDKYYYSSQITRFYIDAEDKSICDKQIDS